MKAIAALLALLAAGPVFAQAILHAAYDRAHDAIAVRIAYLGTTARHRFRPEWTACDRSGDVPQAAVRLVDEQGDEPALKEFRVTQRVSVAALECRPAQVTIRTGRVSLATVDVPPPQAPRPQGAPS